VPELGQRPKLTNKVLFVLSAINLIDCINVTLLTPYVDEMVSDFMGLKKEDPQVGHVVGVLIGLYSVCEVFCSALWGTFADRFGRKPALLIGLGGSVIAPIMFGLGKSLPVVFAARALDGFFCGNIGVTRTCLGELADETNEAKAFGTLGVTFSFGLLIGPVLGGQLVHPARFAPGIFAGTIFDTCPYLLPNLTYATFAAIAWVIGAVFLEETLPRSSRRRCCIDRSGRGLQRQTSFTGTDPSGAPQIYPMHQAEARAGERATSRRFPRTLVVIIATYCAISGCNAAANQLFILMVSYPVERGGFDFGPAQIGFVQNSGALGLLLMQVFIYPKLCKKYGYFRVLFVGWSMFVTVWSFFPLYAVLADTSKFGNLWRFVGLSFMQFISNASLGMIFPTAFSLINRASSHLEKGAVNGIANSCGAIARGVYPPVFAIFLGWAAKPGRPDGIYLPIHALLLSSTAMLVCGSRGLREASRLTMQKLQRPIVQVVDQAEVSTDGSCGRGPSPASSAAAAPGVALAEGLRAGAAPLISG